MSVDLLDFVLKSADLTALQLLKLILIGSLLLIAFMLGWLAKYVRKEVKTLKLSLAEQVEVTKVLKKDVDACHDERRKLQLRSDRQQRSIDDGEAQKQLLSSLILEMRNKAND